jgi:hypothetical protein
MPVWASDRKTRRSFGGAFCVLALLALPAGADTLRDGLQAGVWGSDFYPDQLCNNPHRITLTDGDKRLIFTWDHPILYHTGAMLRVIGSTVVGRSFDRYIIEQDGEDRKNPDGTTLQFDVYLTPDGSYCFYQTGFTFNDCPHPNHLCGALPPNA